MNTLPSSKHSTEAPIEGLVPKVIGADFEFGNFVVGAPESSHGAWWVARGLLREIAGVPNRSFSSIGSGYGGSSSGYGMGSTSYGAGSTSYGGGSNHDDRQATGGGPQSQPEDTDSQDWGRKFLLNGGCAYVDLSHLELCTPEVVSAYDHVAACHALYRIARQAVGAFNERLPEGQKGYVLANNSDGFGNSYGSHLNFLISRAAFDNLFQRRLQHQLWLAAYQASSIIFCGQGKVGSENNAATVPYQLSQRADFVEMLSGWQTTFRRPLINSRDEALCGEGCSGARGQRWSDELARLHVIFYDHTLCHTATLLKAGVLQIILAMLEGEDLNFDLVLEDPVEAVVAWSHDPGLRRHARLLGGGEISALDLQFRFLEEARRFVEAGRCEGIVPFAAEIVALWADTLEKLRASNYSVLARRLDWVLKRLMLELALRDQPELRWDSPQIKQLDHLYSSVDPVEGLYWGYDANFAERQVTEAHIGRFLDEAPADTRAWTRAALLRMADPAEVEAIDWDYVRFRILETGPWPRARYYTVPLPDPLGGTRAELARKLPETGRLLDAVRALGAEPTDPARDGYSGSNQTSWGKPGTVVVIGPSAQHSN